MWESRRLLARFPRGSWEEWEACFWLSTLSTGPSFPQLSSAFRGGFGSCWAAGLKAGGWLLRSGLFLLLAVL